jgi:anti-sigma B factor antagonist
MEVVGDVGVIRVQGDLDSVSAPQLQSAVDTLLGDGARSLTIDCRAVDFIDSSGLQVFVHAHRRAHERSGVLSVRRPSPFINHLMQITGLDGVLQIDGISEPERTSG